MEDSTLMLAIRIPPMIALAVALHTRVLPHLHLFGVGADVLLLVSIAGGLVAGPRKGAWSGFIAGLIADTFLHTPFGLSALTYCIIGYGVGTLRAGVLQMSWWLPTAATFIGSVVGVTSFVVLGSIMGQEHLWSWQVPMIALVVAVLNVVLSPLVLRATRWALSAGVEPRMAR